MTTLHTVFAYGSNMSLRDLARWLDETGHGPLAPARSVRATLPDHRLVWNYRSPVRRGGAANVEHAPGTHVPGVLLHVDDALLVALDVKEGHPERYLRSQRPVVVDDEHVDAWVYEVTEAWRHDDIVRPRRSYVETVLRGASDFGLPEEHLELIRAVETLD